MQHQEYIDSNLGKYVEVAGSANAKNQCVDAANGYIRDVLGLPIVEWTNAVDFPEKAGGSFDFIANTKEVKPNPGDLVIFKQYKGLYGEEGHIGVVVYADLSSMKVFEQNYPTGSACRIGDHNYLGCRGWLRAKPRTSGYGDVFSKYGYPVTIPVETLEIIFSKYHEWRDKLLSKQLYTQSEVDEKLKDVNTALTSTKISLQNKEAIRAQVSKLLFAGDGGAEWDAIAAAIPKIISEADSDKKPAKAAHELFVKINEFYHGVYVYPEDIDTAIEAFYGQFLKYKSVSEAVDAQAVKDEKEEVLNVPAVEKKSLLELFINMWRSIYAKREN